MTVRTLARVAVALVVLGAGAAAGAGGPARPYASHDGPVAQQVDADSVLLRIDLRPDGSAAWTVEHRIRLDDENATRAFESLREDVESDPENFTDRFARRMRATARAAENATGREMSIRNVTVRAERRQLPREYGVVVYTFEWTGFAEARDGTIRAGDALEGLFLDSATRLVVGWPAGYGLEEVSPPADETRERAVVWAGPTDFVAGEPLVVVSRDAGGATPTPAPTPAGGPGVFALLAAVLVALAVAGGAAAWYRRRGPGAGAGGNGAGDDGDGPPEELLSNEERVMKLVRERGGRIKQQEIVEAFGWTEARTSQVVRDLREQGKLEGFRLGRENVLRLPGDEGET